MTRERATELLELWEYLTTPDLFDRPPIEPMTSDESLYVWAVYAEDETITDFSQAIRKIAEGEIQCMIHPS